jgi:hypothetical protein
MLSVWANQLDCGDERVREHVNVVESEEELKSHDSSCAPYSILMLSPNIKKEVSHPYTKTLRKLGTVLPLHLFSDSKYDNWKLYSVYAKSPRIAPPLTFMLSAKVAGVPAKCLWDTGAATSFMSQGFALQHGFEVKPCYTTITVATGIQPAIHGRVTAKLKIQKYCHEVAFLVMDMLPQFDLILGNDWSMRHGVRADFGNPSKPNATNPHLKLRLPQVSLYPVREIEEKHSRV